MKSYTHNREGYVLEYWNPEYPLHWQRGAEFDSMDEADAAAMEFKSKYPKSSVRVILKQVSTKMSEVRKYGDAT